MLKQEEVTMKKSVYLFLLVMAFTFINSVDVVGGLVDKFKKEVKRVENRLERAREKHVDPVGDKIGKEAERVENKLERAREKHIDPIGDDIEETVRNTRDELVKAKEKLANDWNTFREDEVDPIGDTVALIYYSMKDGRKDFPDGFEQMIPRRIANPDASAILQVNFFNYLLNRLMEKSIPLDKDNPNSNNYFSLSGAKLYVDHGRQVLVLKGSDGMLGLEAMDSKIKGGVRINAFTLELFPNSKVQNGKILIDISAKLVYLDLDNTPPLVERAIAHGVHREKFNKGPLATIDVTDLLKVDIPYMNREDSFTLSLKDASLYLGGSLILVELELNR